MKFKFKNLSTIILICCLIVSCVFSANAAAYSDILDKINSTSTYLSSLDTPTVGSVGGEWIIIGLARNESLSENTIEEYYQNVLSYVQSKDSAKLHNSKSTDNSRVIIALTAIEKDVTNVAGYNLLEPLADFNYVKKQGINGPIWALIAFDSLNYEIPTVSSVSTQTTRDLLIEYLLDEQLEDGGWALSGDEADPDITGMVVVALSKYYQTNNEVHTAIDKALDCISDIQTEDGGFSSWGSVNSESCAQIIVALTSLGINPDEDMRFIKNSSSVIDALMSFSTENGFMHINGYEYDQMATEQGFYALVSYKRLMDGKTSLYDMTDLAKSSQITYDVNEDGSVDISDATFIQKYLANLEVLTDTQYKQADCNADGMVDISDATHIQKYLAKIL
jgi:hypothetical protein